MHPSRLGGRRRLGELRNQGMRGGMACDGAEETFWREGVEVHSEGVVPAETKFGRGMIWQIEAWAEMRVAVATCRTGDLLGLCLQPRRHGEEGGIQLQQ
jgi:hypothetical protein